MKNTIQRFVPSEFTLHHNGCCRPLPASASEHRLNYKHHCYFKYSSER